MDIAYYLSELLVEQDKGERAPALAASHNGRSTAIITNRKLNFIPPEVK